MEQANMTTENLRNTMATVDAMKVANKELKKQYGKVDIDKIESIHYDMEDLIESANEIQESMSRTYGVPEELDEADLQAGAQAKTTDRSCLILSDPYPFTRIRRAGRRSRIRVCCRRISRYSLILARRRPRDPAGSESCS